MFWSNSLPFVSPGEVFCEGSKDVEDQSGISKRGNHDEKGKRDSNHHEEEEDKGFVCARDKVEGQ